jgi:hypothetical protein
VERMHQSYKGLEERLKLIIGSCSKKERMARVKLLVYYYALESSNLAYLAKLAKDVLIEIGFNF